MTKFAIFFGGFLTIGMIAALWLLIPVKSRNSESSQEAASLARTRIEVLSRGLERLKELPSVDIAEFAAQQIAMDQALIEKLSQRLRSLGGASTVAEPKAIGASAEEISSQLSTLDKLMARLQEQALGLKGQPRSPSSLAAMSGIQQQLESLRGQQGALQAELARRREASLKAELKGRQLVQEGRIEKSQLEKRILEASVDMEFWRTAKFDGRDQAINGMESAMAVEKDRLKESGTE